MVRIPLVAGNWKMYKTNPEAVALAQALVAGLPELKDREAVIAPPFTALSDVEKIIRDSYISLAGQNACWENEGAFTGEVSPAMLKNLGCGFVIIGHSERRSIFGETNQMIARKLRSVLDAGLKPIFCIGETLQEREAEQTWEVLKNQIVQGLEPISSSDMFRVAIAYEPVWAIGTGKTASDDQAEEAHAFIRTLIERIYSKNIASDLRILYGGSVKPSNVDGLMTQPDIDGVLVGGASLKAESFLRIINFKM